MMKNKRLIWMLMLLGIALNVRAQQHEIQLYQQLAGDYANLYQGHLEDELVQRLWANHPYLETSEFRSGNICYGGVVYENVPMRYDAHAQHVVVMSPVRNAKVVPDQKLVEWFTQDGNRFVPNEARGGFSRLVYKGDKVSLLDHQYKTEGIRTENMGKMYRSFNDHQQYYVVTADGQHKPVSTLGQLSKLFPEFKHELHKHATQQHLKFTADQRETSLTSCISYLNTLIP